MNTPTEDINNGDPCTLNGGHCKNVTQNTASVEPQTDKYVYLVYDMPSVNNFTLDFTSHELQGANVDTQPQYEYSNTFGKALRRVEDDINHLNILRLLNDKLKMPVRLQQQYNNLLHSTSTQKQKSGNRKRNTKSTLFINFYSTEKTKYKTISYDKKNNIINCILMKGGMRPIHIHLDQCMTKSVIIVRDYDTLYSVESKLQFIYRLYDMYSDIQFIYYVL